MSPRVPTPAHMSVNNGSGVAYDPTLLSSNAGFPTVFYGYSTVTPNNNILISNCEFLDGNYPINLRVLPSVSNVLVISNAFLWDGSNTVPSCSACYSSGNNCVFIGNVFNGNTDLPSASFADIGTNLNYDTNIGNYNTAYSGANNFIWCVSGGNIFVARNTILNNGYEGVHVDAGPSAIVGNFYSNLFSDPNCCALNAFNGHQPGLTGYNVTNYSTCFIGNSVYGGRYGELGAAGTQLPLPYKVNVSGNSFSLYPAYNVTADYPGAAVLVQDCQSASVCGNTFGTNGGGLGFSFHGTDNSALILNNNFSNVTYRAIGYGGAGDSLYTAQIFGNILGEGVSFHVQLTASNSFGWFLDQNTYLNSSSNSVPPFLDPASSAVHIVN